MLFSGIYKEKTVLITGHTGFKGGWLSLWLNSLGANVIGISLDPNSKKSFFNINKIEDKVEDIRLDIRNLEELKRIFQSSQPDFVFHLAAQPLVKRSYLDPVETWNTNLLGTVNILESIRSIEKKCACVIITSDKCYENNEWVWGYREDDRLGGADPYSASKGCAELAIKSYINSFFKSSQNDIRISSARAGNVIGGGDWSEDRLVPDCIKSWSSGEKVSLRSPNSTRPWQHVLEPISGYLTLAKNLYVNSNFHGESFNFGPSVSVNYSVEEIVEEMSKYWERVSWESNEEKNFNESGLLKLNCDKALMMLNWKSILPFDETIRFTIEWYKEFYNNYSNIEKKSIEQIMEYVSLASKESMDWTD